VPERDRGWHRAPLLAGAIFTVLGALFLLDDQDVVDVRAGVILPVILITLGLALLVSRPQT